MLNTKAVLIFSPKHIGMFLAGCLILCLPCFEKKNRLSDWKVIFQNNAMMAGGLETFMLIFVGISREGVMPGDVMTEIALGMRPLFYGFVCYMILRDGEAPKAVKEEKGPETQKEVSGHDFSLLTRQERCVAELIGRGLTNREIGEELCISEATVKKHVSNIFEKLGISSRRELR
ncbi:MAG: response regulator transcription factor [Lachnospiraceae bacterium]|nr:response regulator transcription factor [Lachnospiraceae bacterium]